MKKLNFISLVLGILCLASCAGDKEPVNPQAGNLSSVIEADPELLVAGQWIEFEVEETIPPTQGYSSKEVTWYANNVPVLDFYCTEDGNEYKTVVLLAKDASEVTIKIKIVYKYGSKEVVAAKEQTFVVAKPDVHQFVWGCSEDVVEDNLNVYVEEKENSLFFPEIVSEYWQDGNAKSVIANYDFSADKLIKITEGYSEALPDASDKSYKKITYNYTRALHNLSNAFGMPEIGGDWLAQPTDEEIDALAAVTEGYSVATDAEKVIVGKAIAAGKLELVTVSNGTTNTKVEFSVFLNAEGVPTYMMVFTPNN